MSERQFVTDEPPPRPSLDEGTSAHYSDATYYDRAYRRLKADLNFYLQTALEIGGPVLELGCGTGRVTFPIASAGIDIVGVDLSEEMLDTAEDKLEVLSPDVRERVTLLHEDVRSVDLDRKFRLIISPFNVLQHLYTRADVEKCLDVVKAHLMPRAGRFVFDVLQPDIRGLGRNPARKYKLGQVYHPLGDKRYFYQESFDYDPVMQVQYITMYFEDPDDPEGGSFETPLCHRQFFPAELEALLTYNGLRVLNRYGSFDRQFLQEDSESQIYLCKMK